jgi:SAM-dependent methyltransferase
VKVGDIKPEALRDGQRAAMQKDIAWLAARRAQFEDVPCPACRSIERAPLYEKNGFDHVRCHRCGTQYVCPRPSVATLGEFYAQSENYSYWAKHIFPVSAEVRREQIFKPRAKIVSDFARERGLVGGAAVEVGAGYGLFCEELRKLGVFQRIIAIEPTPNLARVCRERGIETLEAPYEAINLGSVSDLIAAFEVIEHLYNPETFFLWAFKALRPNGFLMVTCPNSRGFDTLVLGREADAVDHEHLNLFHPESIRLLAERVGFDSVSVETPGRLDFDIVRRAHEQGRIDAKGLGPFLTALVTDADPARGEQFQAFLQRARLSSNMMLTARRPAAAG